MEYVSSKVIEQLNKNGIKDLDQLDAYCVHNNLAHICYNGKVSIFSNETGKKIGEDKPKKGYNHLVSIVKKWYDKHN